MKKFFKNKNIMIAVSITIIIFLVIIISSNKNDQMGKIVDTSGKTVLTLQKPLAKADQVTIGFFEYVFSYKSSQEEKNSLEEEIKNLKQALIVEKLKNDELDELRELAIALNYLKNEGQDEYIAANLISKDAGNWFNAFTIDVGTDQGIKKDAVVINGEGLIGKVYEVGSGWAKVMAIIDGKSSISFQILRNHQYIGVLTGSMADTMDGYLIDAEAEVIVGDQLITSGISIFQEGIPIGIVESVDKDEENLLKTIKVVPNVNFKHIDKVLVLKEL